tara:strand:+ start:766 stop:2148 length:1383 start_codon:yes stop_codon:yes gene_type:complete
MVSFILPGNSATGGFEVANSIRFDEATTTFLSKASFGTPTSTKKSTVSFWCKRSLVEEGIIFMNDSNTFPIAKIYFTSAHKFSYIEFDPSVYLERTTNALFRDVAAWSHFVVSVDMTLSSADDRVKIYHNGTQITSFSASTTPAQDSNVIINNNLRTGIGGTGSSGGDGFEGYVAELVRIDGQALDPTSFGEFDEDSPTIWKPKNVSGLTFGTNGFYLDFENSSELGTDVSGASNTFTENNLTAEHQSTDTCTNNFVTWNPLDNGRTYSGTIDLSEGNLKQSNANDASLISTVAINKGKWYMEFKVEDADNTRTFGIIDMAESNGYVGHPSVASLISYGYKSSDGTLWIGRSEQASSVGTTSAGDIVSMAIDLDSSTKTIKWQKNGSDLSGTTQLTISHTGYYWGIICRCDGGQVINANFGSPAYSISSGNSDADGHGNFEYAVPSGYFALCTKNLAEYG